MRKSVRRTREEYRERTHVDTAKRLRKIPSSATLDMTADLIESVWSLRDAGEKALVRSRR